MSWQDKTEPPKTKSIGHMPVCTNMFHMCGWVCSPWRPCSTVLLSSIWSLWVLHSATGTLPLLWLIAWHLTSAMLHCSVGEDRRIERDERVCVCICVYLSGWKMWTSDWKRGKRVSSYLSNCGVCWIWGFEKSLLVLINVQALRLTVNEMQVGFPCGQFRRFSLRYQQIVLGLIRNTCASCYFYVFVFMSIPSITLSLNNRRKHRITV